VGYLAAPAREGRGLKTQGLREAGAYLEGRLAAAGVAPGCEDGYRQPFTATVGVKAEKVALSVGGRPLEAASLTPLAFSSSGTAVGPLVLAGHGIVAPELHVDDYAGRDVRGALVVVRRFVPERRGFDTPRLKRTHGDLRHKAWLARERGAKGILVVDWPEGQGAEEAAPPSLESHAPVEAGLLALVVRGAALAPFRAALERREALRGEVTVRLSREEVEAFNVVGRVEAPLESRQTGAVVLGAHYDHLGLGGRESLAPGVFAPHPGADDNASGTAAVLEAARWLSAHRHALRRDVLVVAFSGEEAGVLGSTHFTRAPCGAALEDVVAMVNLDMVGRLRGGKLSVLGSTSSADWEGVLTPLCAGAGLTCAFGGDGYGPSDHMPFYAAGVPVVHLFTGVHGDYHKPSDTVETVHVEGLAKVAHLAATTSAALSARPQRLAYHRASAPTPPGDLRGARASLGTLPDYGGSPEGKAGVLLAGVRAGGAAEQAGLGRGDLLLRLGTHDLGSVEDLLFALGSLSPGAQVELLFEREGARLSRVVTLQAAGPWGAAPPSHGQTDATPGISPR
jgi:hypothetical protein